MSTTETMTDRERVRRLFRRLRKRGILARMNFSCCGGCASGELAELLKPQHGGGVYFHQQDADAFDGERLTAPLYIGYGAAPNGAGKIEDRAALIGRLVKAEAERIGLLVKWDGDTNTRIALIPTTKPEWL